MRVRFALRIVGIALIVAQVLALAPGTHAQATALYFPATGHTLTDDAGFLSFWQAHDGERLLGLPVSEPIIGEDSTIQYFERGRLEQQIDPNTGTSRVRPGSVGKDYAEALWRSFPPAPPRPQTLDIMVFPETDHTLRQPFLGFWKAGGGSEFFGPPISEPLWEKTPTGQKQVQYFTNARLERDASLIGTTEEIRVSDLGQALAALRAVDMAPVANPGYELAGPASPLPADVGPLNPTPVPTVVPAPAEPPPVASQPAPKPRRSTGGSKSIVVNLTDQWLYAYEGDTLVFDAPVATGRDGMNTPTGTFSIYAKLPVQTMDGITDGERWVVPNVPDVMYFNGGVALHGTYWHNLFGSGARPSHGCVNLPLKSAAWLYDWAPIGTSVRVTY